MSKTTKAKTDKHGKAAPTTATPQLISEIIPGKFTDSDWLAVLQLDDNEDFIGSIVQDIKQIVDDKIKAIEIERQLAPYAVGQVMTFVLDLFKLAYPEHQECQLVDYSWKADFAPECCAIDSWAEGSVPKQILTPAMIEQSIEEEEYEEPVMEASDQYGMREEEVYGLPIAERIPTENMSAKPLAPTAAIRLPKEHKHTVIQQKPKSFKPNVSVLSVQRAIGIVEAPKADEANVLFGEVTAMAESSSTRSKIAGSSKATKTALIAAVGKASLQREKGRPPMEKDVNYDAFGNIVSMIRISPESFPPLFVQTDYMVVDPRVEKANAELEAMRTGRYIHAANDQRRLHIRQPLRLRPLQMTPALAAIKFAAEQNAIASNQPSPDSRAQISIARLSSANRQRQKQQPSNGDKSNGKALQSSRSIIEQIDLSPGVDIREGSQEKRGADLRLLSGAIFLQQDAALQPMTQRPQVTTKLMDVNQFVTKAPVIKPAIA